jgi:hypothetical protein
MIRCSLIVSSVLLTIGCGPGSPTGMGGLRPEVPVLSVKLGMIPELGLTPGPAVDETQAKRIKNLIANLAALDRPDFGLSATLSGIAFAPLSGHSQAGALLLTDHELQTSEALKALVTLGPDALPFLLDALDDKTPTKLTINHDGNFGIMWHAAELHLNPVNPSEQAAAKARAVNPSGKEEHVESYTVKVGDVCFVAIGQIVGRSYQTVRYQPTACVVLNCPTHDPNLCAEVRAIWGAKDPKRKLFDSLRADYATEGVFNGNSLDGWYAGSELQCGAALRLLFYFAQDASPLVASRLDKLDVGKDRELDGFMRRCVANGVQADDFVKAVVWSKAPAVRSSLVSLFKRAEDVDTLLASLPAIEDSELVRGRLEPLIAALPADEEGPYGHGFHLLAALGQRTPKTAKAVFDRYLRGASAQRCHTVCLVLREVKPSWDADLLDPLLTDTRTWGWTYAVEAGKNEPRLPIRVCDEAAVTLSRNHPNLTFTQTGEHASLDKQIAAIRETLAGKK